MAGRVISFFFFAFLILGINAAGEFSVLYSPTSLRFSGTSRILESLLKEVYSASLGLSVEENSEWNGLAVEDPFDTPEAVVEVYIDGVSSLGKLSGLKSKDYPLTVDEYEPDMYEALQHRISQRFTNGGNKLVNIKLSDPDELASYSSIFGAIPKSKVMKEHLEHLKKTVDEDYLFLSELGVLRAITAQVQSGVITADNIVDFYNFRFQSLHALSDVHGPNSLQTKEAKKLLGGALEELRDAFIKAYEGSVLVTVVATDVAHTRRVRAATPDAPASNKQSSSTDAASPDFPAIFNIILWFGLVFVFALISIVYTIMDMDPGRDSIIYRMTSTRMKKDN